MTGSIKISICCDHCYLGIRTYSREHGSHGRFLLRRELVEALLSDKSPGGIIDTDLNSFVVVRLDGDALKFQFYWLGEYADQILTGLRQAFTLPKSAVEDLLAGDIVTKCFLYQPPARSAKIDHMSAARTVLNAVSDKRTRRALSKAMRDTFQWPGEQVTLYNDGGCNFLFTTKRETTETGFNITGGLILHEGTRNGYPKVYYSVHT